MNSSLARKFALVVVVAAYAMTMSACNTTKGAGRDMERAGEKIQDASDDARN